MPKEKLGERCIEYRKEHGLSRRALAALCGVHENTIYRAEHGLGTWMINAVKIERIIGGGENNESGD